MFDEREWPETFTKAENIAKMIQGATYFGDVFQGDLDRKMIHVIVTAKRVDEGRSDEERDEITSLPEIIRAYPLLIVLPLGLRSSKDRFL